MGRYTDYQITVEDSLKLVVSIELSINNPLWCLQGDS
jgi:hypothetical protein